MADADFEGPLVLSSANDATWVWGGRVAEIRSAKAYLFGKRLLDIVGALALTAVFAPVLVVIVLALRRSGAIFFPHERVGLHGRKFRCYKFRTMVPDAETRLRALLDANAALAAEWKEVRKLRNDPRVTAVGRFLRKTSLDELPQLWNVLRGEMTLVGPRPIVGDEVPEYGRSIGVYLAVKPGLTGLWQVSGRSETDYRRRVALDVYYARNRSWLLDLGILLKTVRVVLVGQGAY